MLIEEDSRFYIHVDDVHGRFGPLRINCSAGYVVFSMHILCGVLRTPLVPIGPSLFLVGGCCRDPIGLASPASRIHD